MTDLINLVEYQRWANQQTADQLTVLTNEMLEKEFGGSFPSMRLTVLHLLQADYRWLHRLKGTPSIEVPAVWQTTDTKTLLTTWLTVQDQLVEQVKTFQTNEPIHFTTAKGDRYELPLREVITHVVNHATYHRGQLVTMLRMAGVKPVSTDYFLFVVTKNK